MKPVRIQTIANEIKKIYDKRHQGKFTIRFHMLVTVWTNVVYGQLANLEAFREWQEDIPRRLLYLLSPEEREKLREDALKTIPSSLYKPAYTYHIEDLNSLDTEHESSPTEEDSDTLTAADLIPMNAYDFTDAIMKISQNGLYEAHHPVNQNIRIVDARSRSEQLASHFTLYLPLEHAYGIDLQRGRSPTTSEVSDSVDEGKAKTTLLKNILKSGCDDTLFVGGKYDYLENVPEFKGWGVLMKNKDDKDPDLQLYPKLAQKIIDGRFDIQKVEEPYTWEKRHGKK
uniref:AlNc14C336G10736 protein n=1 Tax=Albugo laibachii Nc14 TaxID=890382 RepID=F0WWX5_9STRA|nr:AlNc14C336G10736 [Albugo laibachii Nc14]|eukprot:CCA25960.1 AlNc14C336G10736 [Albugo laibachii Nc14]